MTTAIIGIGNIGGALARDLVRGGEHVVLASRDQVKAASAAQKLGELATAASVADAVRQAEAVVLAVAPPIEATKDVVAKAGELLDGKVVFDPSNHLSWEVPGGFRNAAELFVSMLPAKVRFVKAFGTLGAESLGSAGFRVPRRAVLFYATDDQSAAPVAERLISAAGFDPVNIGGIADAARIEVPGGDLHQFGGLNGRLLDADEARAAVRAAGAAA